MEIQLAAETVDDRFTRRQLQGGVIGRWRGCAIIMVLLQRKPHPIVHELGSDEECIQCTGRVLEEQKQQALQVSRKRQDRRQVSGEDELMLPGIGMATNPFPGSGCFADDGIQ